MSDKVELLQGTLDLIVLRALATMGPQHAYGLAERLEQVAEHPLMLNQGTLYPALVRLEQKGWIKGAWQRTESNREAKYYSITKTGTRALEIAGSVVLVPVLALNAYLTAIVVIAVTLLAIGATAVTLTAIHSLFQLLQ